MKAIKRIVIVAGEESSDSHAANIVRQLNAKHPNLHFSGVGGRNMREAGVELVSDLARFGVTGLMGIVSHMPAIYRAFKAIKSHLKENKPDLLILVDSPSFNLRLATFAKQELGIRTLYYISPQIWAWKANRIHTIRANVDKMAVILPFEKKIYEAAGVPVSFVGHPLVEKVKGCDNIEQARTTLGLPLDKRIIAMLPGSRIHEIEYHMPVLVKSAARLNREFDDLHIVIPVAGTIDPATIHGYFKGYNLPYTLIKGQSIETVACSDCAVVASGTASLECALLEKPMCIIYKGGAVSYMATFKLIKVKFLGLCNLLQNEMIAPELLQYDCNPVELTRVVRDLLTDPAIRQRMVTRLKKLKQSLSAEKADCSITTLIEHEINLELF